MTPWACLINPGQNPVKNDGVNPRPSFTSTQRNFKKKKQKNIDYFYFF